MASKKDALSHSRLYTYQKCKKAYEYKYVHGIYPKPATQNIESWQDFTLGILGHAGIEGGLMGAEPASYIEDEANTMRAKQLGTAKEALLVELVERATDLATQALEALPLSDWEVAIYQGKPLVEFELRAPLPGWADGFLGYLDSVLKERSTGQLFVFDYKFRKRFESEAAQQFNTQFPYYQHCLGLLGVPVVGSALFEIKTSPAKTTEQFKLTKFYRTKALVEGHWQNLEKVAAEMKRPQQFYTNASDFNCGRCEYQQLCQTELRGEDTEYVLNNFYDSLTRATVSKSSVEIIFTE